MRRKLTQQNIEYIQHYLETRCGILSDLDVLKYIADPHLAESDRHRIWDMWLSIRVGGAEPEFKQGE